MAYLLDTHTLIWMLEGDSRLPISVSTIITNNQDLLWVSSVSFWEISIKRSLGKLKLAHNTIQFWEETNRQSIQILNIRASHLSSDLSSKSLITPFHP